MLTPPSARAWQSLPSVPGLSSRLIVNSLAVGMWVTSFSCVSETPAARSFEIENPWFRLKKRKRPFPSYLGPVGPSGRGRTSDYSCDLHREFTSFPHWCAAVPKLQTNLPTGGADGEAKGNHSGAAWGPDALLRERFVP